MQKLGVSEHKIVKISKERGIFSTNFGISHQKESPQFVIHAMYETFRSKVIIDKYQLNSPRYNNLKQAIITFFPKSFDKMCGSQISGTLFNVRSQNWSKNFLKSPLLLIFTIQCSLMPSFGIFQISKSSLSKRSLSTSLTVYQPIQDFLKTFCIKVA